MHLTLTVSETTCSSWLNLSKMRNLWAQRRIEINIREFIQIIERRNQRCQCFNYTLQITHCNGLLVLHTNPRLFLFPTRELEKEAMHSSNSPESHGYANRFLFRTSHQESEVQKRLYMARVGKRAFFYTPRIGKWCTILTTLICINPNLLPALPHVPSMCLHW